jgi:hypothetical protein
MDTIGHMETFKSHANIYFDGVPYRTKRRFGETETHLHQRAAKKLDELRKAKWKKSRNAIICTQ